MIKAKENSNWLAFCQMAHEWPYIGSGSRRGTQVSWKEIHLFIEQVTPTVH